MNRRHHSNRYSPSGYGGGNANQQMDPHQSALQSFRSSDAFQSMMPLGLFDDSLFPSPFGPSGLMPQTIASMTRDRHSRHLTRSASAIDDCTGMMLAHQRSLGSIMGGMMSSMGELHRDVPNGCFSSQVMVMSSTVGPDGREHVEKYAKSSSGNFQHKIGETKEAYSNSSSGVEKLAWERQLDSKGRRVVKERNRETGAVTSNDEIIGMTRDDECERFNEEWNRVAEEHLPIRPSIRPCVLNSQASHHQITGGHSGIPPRQPRQIQAADVTNEVEDQPRRSQRASRHR